MDVDRIKYLIYYSFVINTIMKTTREHIKNILIDHGVQPSSYRIRILECLSEPNKHPTADEIYQHLLEDFPTVSKMTVYNTIDVLLEASLIRKITMGHNEARYDGALSEHGHFKCQVCHKIFNFEIDLSLMKVEGLNHFKVDSKDVYFYGTCEECTQKSMKEITDTL